MDWVFCPLSDESVEKKITKLDQNFHPSFPEKKRIHWGNAERVQSRSGPHDNVTGRDKTAQALTHRNKT
jgi:hypothetical protein